MKMKINGDKLSGTVAAMSSKSDAHRVLICAALCAPGERTDVRITDISRDMEATMDCIKVLGADVLKLPDGRVRVIAGEAKNGGTFNCCESGSTLRFMLPVVAARCRDTRFVGEGRLPERPMTPFINALNENGAGILPEKLPFSVKGGLKPGKYVLPGNVSSQYITGLLLALPLLDGDSEIVLTSALESAPYVEMTVNTLKRFGVDITKTEKGFAVSGGAGYRSPVSVDAEGDWSNAAFWLAAGALKAPVTVTGLDMDSKQGDKKITELLSRFGAEVTEKNGCVTVSPGKLKGITIDVADIPDLVPILAVTACAAEGETRIVNAARLRMKESDRLAAVAEGITRLGGCVEELSDGLVVHGGAPLEGGEADSFSDHRIAMALSIASIISRAPVAISGAEAVNKSYPRFYEDFRMLGGAADEQ